jgi:hypothetical protein
MTLHGKSALDDFVCGNAPEALKLKPKAPDPRTAEQTNVCERVCHCIVPFPKFHFIPLDPILL